MYYELGSRGVLAVSTYLEDADELRVGDLLVLVQVEVVVDASQVLAGQENSELGDKLFEFKSGEGA